MSVNSFRDYLETLESQDQLFRIREEVDTLDDMGALVARADYEGLHKALLFENPKGFDIPVLANTVGSGERRIAGAFGVPTEGAVPKVAQKMGQAMASGGIAPVEVDKSKARCKEVILKGEDADLTKLPILRLNPGDGGSKHSLEGRFISSLVCSKPSPQGHNLSYHRFEMQGPRHGPVWVFRLTGDAKSISESWGAAPEDPVSAHDKEKGEPFPTAFVFGVTPLFLLAGANPGLPHKNDDFASIGAMAGEAVEMVKCETVDVDVPAHAEIVVEGVYKPFNWGLQGRFRSRSSST
jgi:UbiD family decarboxylase